MSGRTGVVATRLPEVVVPSIVASIDTSVLPPESVTAVTVRITPSSAVGVVGTRPIDCPTEMSLRRSPESVSCVPPAVTVKVRPDPASVGISVGTDTSTTEAMPSSKRVSKANTSSSDVRCTKGIEAVRASLVPSTS